MPAIALPIQRVHLEPLTIKQTPLFSEQWVASMLQKDNTNNLQGRTETKNSEDKISSNFYLYYSNSLPASQFCP